MPRSKRFKLNTIKRIVRKKNFVNVVFLGLLFAIVIVGLVRTLIAPNDILEYENRMANKVDKFTISGFLSGNYQDSFEDAFSDQLFSASEVKENYNLVKSSFIKDTLAVVAKNDDLPDSDDSREIEIGDDAEVGGNEITNKQTPSAIEIATQPAIEVETSPAIEPEKETTKSAVVNPDKGEATSGKYYSVGSGLYLFNDWVVQGLASFKANQPRIDKYVARYNELIDLYPDIDFYLYYIERDSDQNYASGSRAGISDYIKSTVNIPEDQVGIQVIKSFEEYKEYNYKSDHHWNYKGSYAGYKDILAMIKPNEAPLAPLAEYKIGYTRGSFTKTDATAGVTDDFYAYEFDYPELRYWFNGKEGTDYGNQSKYIENAKNGNTNQYLKYAGFYGTDIGEIAIYNGTGEGCLLIFGNSYDNAVIKLLASHFERTYCVDLRYFKSGMGTSFSFASFLETHPVTDVVAIGNAYYFLQSPFIISK